MPTPPKGNKKSKELLRPPHAQPVSTQISPGATVQIPLRIYGKQYQTVHYILRTSPQFGKVLGIQQVDQEAALLTYQHTSRMTQDDLVETFAFVAQDDNGTSAPEKIEIKIADEPAVLSMPKAVDFGQLIIGVPASRTITIANRGGRTLEGEISVDAPWTISPVHYEIGRHGEATFLVTANPTAEQEYNGRIYFQDRPGIECALHAVAVTPVQIAPSVVDLVMTGSLQRSGSIALQNRTDTVQTVEIEGGARLKLPSQIPLDPGQTLPLVFLLGADDLAAFDETLSVRVGGMAQPVHVRAAAVPAIIHTTPAALQFGKLAKGAKSAILEITNDGGTSADLSAEATPPFQLDAANWTVAPGAKQQVSVTLDAAWTGSAAAKITFHGPDGDHELPLSAEVTPPSPRKAGKQPLGVVDVAPYTEADEGQEGTRPATLFTIGDVKVVRTTPSEAELAWRAPAHTNYIHELQYRQLELDSKSQMHVLWLPVPQEHVTYKQENGVVRAFLTHLPPKMVVTLRVVATDGRLNYSPPTMPVQVALPAKMVIFTWQRLLLAFFVCVLAGALYLNRRNR